MEEEAEPDPTVRAPRLWCEVLVVLLLAYLPPLFSAIFGSDEPGFLVDCGWRMVNALQVSAPLLYLMARSGTPWRDFGIVRPRPAVDVSLAVLLFILDFGVSLVAHSFARWLFPGEPFSFSRPSGPAEGVLFLLSRPAGAFSEELAMRAYLIPRLEKLLRSTPAAILASSILFGSYHLYQGTAPAISIAIMGLLFGSAFAVTRRIWPLVMAHAAWNVIWNW